jgi:hypothetical protein
MSSDDANRIRLTFAFGYNTSPSKIIDCMIEDKKKHKWEGWNSSQSTVIAVITSVHVFGLISLLWKGEVSNSAGVQLPALPLSLCSALLSLIVWSPIYLNTRQ